MKIISYTKNHHGYVLRKFVIHVISKTDKGTERALKLLKGEGKKFKIKITTPNQQNVHAIIILFFFLLSPL